MDECCREWRSRPHIQNLADFTRIDALSGAGFVGYARCTVINARKNQLLDRRLRSQLMGALGAGRLATQLALHRAPDGTGE